VDNSGCDDENGFAKAGKTWRAGCAVRNRSVVFIGLKILVVKLGLETRLAR